MENKFPQLGLEWVVIPKRRIYTIIALLVLMLVSGAGLSFYLYGNSFKHTAEDARADAGARFDMLEGEVRVIRAATRISIAADATTRLKPGDVVQTQPSGRAAVTLSDGSTLTIRPNSVITIAENVATQGSVSARVRVAVESGQVKVSTGKQTPQTSNIVETPLTKNRLSAQTAASFGVLDDKSEEVRVISGTVESKTSLGTSGLTIKAGEYVARSRSGDIKSREHLLDTPVPYAPSDREKIKVGAEGVSDVTLQWAHPLSAPVSYRVEIASSPFFVEPSIIFERQHLVTPRLVVTELGLGDYFWRVRAVSATGQSSEWCGPQKFAVAGN